MLPDTHRLQEPPVADHETVAFVATHDRRDTTEGALEAHDWDIRGHSRGGYADPGAHLAAPSVAPIRNAKEASRD